MTRGRRPDARNRFPRLGTEGHGRDMHEKYRFLYSRAMKTTLDLDDDLVARAKALATRERTSLTSVIEEGLRLRLRARRRAPGRAAAPRLAIYEGRGGLAANVDPRSNRSLLEAAEDDT